MEEVEEAETNEAGEGEEAEEEVETEEAEEVEDADEGEEEEEAEEDGTVELPTVEVVAGRLAGVPRVVPVLGVLADVFEGVGELV